MVAAPARVEPAPAMQPVSVIVETRTPLIPDESRQAVPETALPLHEVREPQLRNVSAPGVKPAGEI
jgi:hypothetical protein